MTAAEANHEVVEAGVRVAPDIITFCNFLGENFGAPVSHFIGITLVDELDKLELRTAAGVTLARGVRDPSLPEPT